MSWSVERVIEIWNDDTGEHFAIGPDRDGLDIVEIPSLIIRIAGFWRVGKMLRFIWSWYENENRVCLRG